MTEAKEFSRPIDVSQYGSKAKDFKIDATADECKQIAKRLGFSKLLSLSAHFTIYPQEKYCFLAHGKMKARCIRQCVVSLEDFEEKVDEIFDLRFIPRSLYPEEEPSLQELAESGDVDELPYENDCIDLGEVAVQQLSLACDPYPHAPGVTETFSLFIDEDGMQHKAPPPTRRPFEVLTNLKKHPKKG